MTVEIKGVQEAINYLENEILALEDEIPTILSKQLMQIAARTRPYVPVDTGKLINSEKREVRRVGTGYTSTLSYYALNDKGQDYAKAVHDGPQRRWKKPGASNRFLERGVDDYLNRDFEAFLQRFVG